MDRREHLKLWLAAAAGGAELVRPAGARAEGSHESRQRSFESQWEQWPDLRWVGPEFWGNRLQDWTIRDGAVQCRQPGPHRTLHCLTHQVVAPAFWTEVDLERRVTGSPGTAPTGSADLIGVRVGIRGPFPDLRSAAVHGQGIDIGVDGAGRMVAGPHTGAVVVRSPDTAPVRLRLLVRARTLEGRGVLNVQILDEFRRVLDAHALEDLDAGDLLGNLALLRHVDEAVATGTSGPEGVGRDGVGAQDDARGAGKGVDRFFRWRIGGEGVVADASAEYGPIVFAHYTLHRGRLKLTAQLAPIDDLPGLTVALDTDSGSGWQLAGEAPIDPLSRTARFRVDDWAAHVPHDYRLRVRIPTGLGGRDFEYFGTIAADPGGSRPLKAAVFSCNADHGFPDSEVVTNVQFHDPDLCLFLGDQFYEGSGGFGIQTDSLEDAALDMLHKWYMFGWSYRELFRHVPVAFIPDDHDVYHGNVWGEGGKVAPTDRGWGAAAQDQGGYKMPAEWVNAVQRAQTSHLPDPYDPDPVEQGIGVYYTDWTYGGVSFAILEDRKFKSAPLRVLPPEAQVVNGWIQNPDFDIRDHADSPEAKLLGDRQMRFLDAWIRDWQAGAAMKVVLSQTNFAAVHTIPQDATSGAVLPQLPVPAPGEVVAGDKLAVDMDSNGWPRTRRDQALRILQRCAAFHIAGDQHLATVVQHGVDEFGDAAYTFTGPALNNIWPRRWWPPAEAREGGGTGGPGYTGDYRDGFGNRITVHAAANPRDTGLEPRIIRDRVTGYGILEFDPQTGRIRVECWPRHHDPRDGVDGQYEGWPIEVDVANCDGRRPARSLSLEVLGMDRPVVLVESESGELVFVRRMGSAAEVPLFGPGPHRLRAGDPDLGLWMERWVGEDELGPVEMDFERATTIDD